MAFVARILLLAVDELTQAGQEATCESLSQRTGQTSRQIADNASLLVKRGLLKRIRPGCYEATKAGHQAIQEGNLLKSGPKAGMSRARSWGLRQKAWRLMRIRGKFSVSDLCQGICDGSEQFAESNLGKYLKALRLAGYITRLARRQKGSAPTSNGDYRYLLVRDSGPEAPVWRKKTNTVFDPNDGKEYVLDEVKDITKKPRQIHVGAKMPSNNSSTAENADCAAKFSEASL
jgi:hypothetical protein